MTDAQQLFDFARKQLNDIATDVERHFDQVAFSLRESFAKSPLSPPPVRRLPPPTTYQQIERWVSRHKAVSAAILAFAITGSVASIVCIQSRHLKKRRRGKKSSSGARTDVVVVAGAVANPLTSALYLDLERRGLVVYVVATTPEDEHYIRSHSRPDLVPLNLDLVDPCTAQEQLMKFRTTLRRDHYAFEHAESHRLDFKGLILMPHTQSEPARVEEISSEDWSDALNAKVLNTIATTQLLLPAVIENRAHVLLLTPSVTPSLKLPLHSIECTAYGALRGFTSSLAAELKQESIHTSHINLGDIDLPSVTAKLRREGVPAPRLRATPLRRLQDTVFDEVMSERPHRTLYLGRGSLTYGIIGSLMPPAFIAWMMGGSGRRTPLARDASDDNLSGSAGSLTWEKVDQDV